MCGCLVWSDYVRTAAAVVLMYRFTAVPHLLLYNSITNNVLVLFTAVGRQMSGFEPSLPCVFVFDFFSFFFCVGERVNGCLSNVLLTVAVGSR